MYVKIKTQAFSVEILDRMFSNIYVKIKTQAFSVEILDRLPNGEGSTVLDSHFGINESTIEP